MKKNIVTILALVLAAVCLVGCFLVTFKLRKELSIAKRRYEELTIANRYLEEQVADLTARLEEAQATQSPAAPAQLHSWTLEVNPWADSTGADILLTAEVENWQEGVSAQLLVQLEGQEILSAPCSWDGASFNVTAALDAADGYGYFLVLTQPDGTSEACTLTTPNNPVQDIPVYLASSLSAYCNLIVSQWEEAEGEILLTSGYIHVQLPRISPEGIPGVESARLVLTHNGGEVHSIPLTLESGETEDSYALSLENLRLPLPETEVDDALELRLEVALSNNTELSAIGINWWRTAEGLDAVVG